MGFWGVIKWSVMLKIIRNLFSLSNTGLVRVRWRVFLGFVEGGDFSWGFFIPRVTGFSNNDFVGLG